jgi:carboxymethylenebutenolidase
VPPAAQAAIKAALSGAGNVTIHSYPGRDHAFARVGGEHYHAADAEAAGARSLAFFGKALG